MNMEERFWHILAKKISNEATPEELSELESLIQGNALYKEYAKDAFSISKAFDVDTSSVQPNVEGAWNKVNQQQSKIITLKKNRTTLVKWSVSIAASFLIIVSSWYFLSQPDSPQVYTSGSEKKEIILDDGTKIWLNKNSSLTVSNKFNKDNRKVKLTGEAYFEVTKNNDLAFEVESKSSATKVLGTSFNIRSIDTDSLITLTVFSGKVNFSSENNNQNVFLLPSHYAVMNLNSGNIRSDTLINTNVLAWKNGSLTFDDTEIRDILITLESYFCVKVEIVDKSILNCRYTGTFNSPTLDEFFTIFTQSLNLNYKKYEDKIVVQGQGCGNEINS